MFSCTPDHDEQLTGHAGCACHRPELQALTRRLNADLSRRGFVAGLGASLAMLGLPRRTAAQPTPPAQSILFRNFRLSRRATRRRRNAPG
jgi:hypothetical protein